MALLWFDGMDTYGTGLSHSPSRCMQRRYPGGNLDSQYSYPGRIVGRSLYPSYGGGLLTPDGLTSDLTLIVGFAYRGEDGDIASGVTTTIMDIWDSATRGLYLYYLSKSGEIEVWRDEASDVLLGTTSGARIANHRWAFIEAKVYCHDTLGTVEIRVNGKTKLSLTGVDTKATGITNYKRVGRSNWPANYKARIDDLYVCDGTGGAANDFLGPIKVYVIKPSADVGGGTWTPQSGVNHYAMVDEDSANDDTDYLETDGSGNLDLFEYADSPSNVGQIHGINLCTECRETDAEAYSLYQVAKRTTQLDGAAEAINGVSYRVFTRLMTQDTEGAAWSKANLDATQFGIKLV